MARAMANVVARGALTRWRRALRRWHVGVLRSAARPNRRYEDLVLSELKMTGPLSLDTLVERVAEDAMHVDRRAYGEIDVAFWGPAFYRNEITQVVRRMVGRSLVLASDGPWLLVAPVSHD